MTVIIEAAACWYCKVDLHDECLAPFPVDEAEPDILRCCCPRLDENQADVEEKRGVGRPLSRAEDMADARSAGRKRAAMLYPIYPGMECAWSGLRFAGGGVQPIVGCQGNTIVDVKGGEGEHRQGDRHHGPDKNTLNNSPQNLHLVCTVCHSRWHALNDKAYQKERPGGEVPYVPLEGYADHNPVEEATELELMESEAWWEKRSEKRGPYPFAVVQ